MNVTVQKNNVIVQVEEKKPVEIVTIGVQGPSAGLHIPGVTTVDQDVLVDIISQNPITAIVGIAIPGSLTSAPVWRMKKIIVPTVATMSIIWADGDTDPNNIWDDRLILNYLTLP